MTPTEWIALLAVLGTLGGAALGAFATVRVQERVLQHSDRTRFHDDRLQVYAAFNRAVNDTMSHFFTAGALEPGSRREAMQQFEMLRLVGSQAVVESAFYVNMCLLEAGDASTAKAGDLATRFNQSVAALVNAMRHDFEASA